MGLPLYLIFPNMSICDVGCVNVLFCIVLHSVTYCYVGAVCKPLISLQCYNVTFLRDLLVEINRLRRGKGICHSTFQFSRVSIYFHKNVTI